MPFKRKPYKAKSNRKETSRINMERNPKGWTTKGKRFLSHKTGLFFFGWKRKGKQSVILLPRRTAVTDIWKKLLSFIQCPFACRKVKWFKFISDDPAQSVYMQHPLRVGKVKKVLLYTGYRFVPTLSGIHDHIKKPKAACNRLKSSCMYCFQALCWW